MIEVHSPGCECNDCVAGKSSSRRKCQPGCTCKRHTRMPRCWAVDDGVRCRKDAKAKTHGLCHMHHSRVARHGNIEKLGNRGAIGAHPDTLKKQAERKAIRDAKLKQMNEEEKTHRCMCGHMKGEHKGKKYSEKMRYYSCEIFDCPCKHYDEGNAELWRERSEKIARLGFIKHLGAAAICRRCDQRIEIGTWFDGWVLKRAGYHVARECAALRKEICRTG